MLVVLHLLLYTSTFFENHHSWSFDGVVQKHENPPPCCGQMLRLVAGIAALLMAISAAYAADWEYDHWRCAAGHKAGNFYIRISSSTEPIEFDIIKNLGSSAVDFKVASVRIDEAVFLAGPGNAFEYTLGPSEPLLRALALGKRLQVFAEGETKPVAEMLIRHGKRVATFLSKCE